MKFLALDIGKKRIGVATCDRLEVAASPCTVVPAGKAAPQMIVDLARKEEVDGLVVGLPVSLNGSEGEACRMVRSFLARLEPLTELPIELVDERLTTRWAETSLIEAGMRRDRRKMVRDAVSAALILKTYLERSRHDGKSVPPGSSPEIPSNKG